MGSNIDEPSHALWVTYLLIFLKWFLPWWVFKWSFGRKYPSDNLLSVSASLLRSVTCTDSYIQTVRCRNMFKLFIIFTSTGFPINLHCVRNLPLKDKCCLLPVELTCFVSVNVCCESASQRRFGRLLSSQLSGSCCWQHFLLTATECRLVCIENHLNGDVSLLLSPNNYQKEP